MKIAVIGLGKMGLGLAENMKDHGIDVIGFDISETARKNAEENGIAAKASVEEVLNDLDDAKIVWSMLPAGKITDEMMEKLSILLNPKDIVIDGGNSNYKDSLKHYDLLKNKGIYFLDAGTSGGMNGARYGANYMVGGDEEAFKQVEELFKLSAQPDGYLYCGPAGSGHYLKMIHNGIEYGMMQAIAEGFDVLEHSPYEYDYENVAKLWNNGSVIRGWLMELAQEAFAKDPKLESIKGKMFSSGEGQWTIEEALNLQVPVPVIALSLMMRNRSLEEDTFSGKVVASLRNGFGGHAVAKK